MNMVSRPASRLTPAVSLGLIRAAAELHAHEQNAAPPAPPTRRREPYSIERFPSLNGAVQLVGYDGAGDVMVEVRIPATRFSEQTIERMRAWMKRHDDQPTTPLSLV